MAWTLALEILSFGSIRFGLRLFTRGSLLNVKMVCLITTAIIKDGLLQVAATVITYFIFLFQMKASESRHGREAIGLGNGTDCENPTVGTNLAIRLEKLV